MIEFYANGDGTTTCPACHMTFPNEDLAGHGMIRGGDSYPWLIDDSVHAEYKAKESEE